jgi:hypothetical protein
MALPEASKPGTETCSQDRSKASGGTGQHELSESDQREHRTMAVLTSQDGASDASDNARCQTGVITFSTTSRARLRRAGTASYLDLSISGQLPRWLPRVWRRELAGEASELDWAQLVDGRQARRFPSASMPPDAAACRASAGRTTRSVRQAATIRTLNWPKQERSGRLPRARHPVAAQRSQSRALAALTSLARDDAARHP